MRRFVPMCWAFAITATMGGEVRADPVVQGLVVATAVVVTAEILGDAPKVHEPDWLSFEAGRFDPIKDERVSTELGLEYRFRDFLLWKLKPFVGAGGTTNGSVYGYAGIRMDTYWGPDIVITPSFAVVGYSQGNGKDLGSPPVLGRFGIDVQFNLENDLRLGIAFHHMSNGKVLGQDENPGTELVGLTLSIPLK